MKSRLSSLTNKPAPCSGRTGRRGYALVDISIASGIAIVGLAALGSTLTMAGRLERLFPVFAQVRESARKASCLSNQRQLGAAVLHDAQDYDERFPQTHPAATPWSFSEDE